VPHGCNCCQFCSVILLTTACDFWPFLSGREGAPLNHKSMNDKKTDTAAAKRGALSAIPAETLLDLVQTGQPIVVLLTPGDKVRLRDCVCEWAWAMRLFAFAEMRVSFGHTACLCSHTHNDLRRSRKIRVAGGSTHTFGASTERRECGVARTECLACREENSHCLPRAHFSLLTRSLHLSLALALFKHAVVRSAQSTCGRHSLGYRVAHGRSFF